MRFVLIAGLLISTSVAAEELTRGLYYGDRARFNTLMEIRSEKAAEKEMQVLCCAPLPDGIEIWRESGSICHADPAKRIDPK